MSSSAPEPIKTAEHGAALVITIDRPHAGNAISLDTAHALGAALAACRDRDDLRGVIITGAGGKFFCTGGDVKAYRAITTPTELDTTFGAVRQLLRAIERHPLPILAAIDGYAIGGGGELAIACDLRFMADSAQIGFPQARLGIIPGWNGTERLVRLIGRARAMRLLLNATRITATEALAIGLVDTVTEDGGALAAALAFIAGLDVAPLSIRGTKEAIRAAAGDPAASAAATSAIFARLWFTDDHREAEAAFVEKRAPVFKGR